MKNIGYIRATAAVSRAWGMALIGFALLPAQTGIHPGFTFASLRPPGFAPMVGGLDFLPDGRLVVCTWDGFGKTKGTVWLVSGATTGDASKITYAKFAEGLNEPLGAKVVDGRIHILQKDQLSWLPDSNGDGKADGIRKVASGWTVQPGTAQSLEFAMGLVHRDGAFFAGLATNWPLTAKHSNERGCIIRMAPPDTGFSNFACGLRTPNGLVLGPGGELFTTENQGNWVPSSKLVHVKAGRFYGVHKPVPGPYDAIPESPPAIWLDHGSIGISPTQPVYLEAGPFKGQMLAGDNRLGTLQRYFLEQVAGEWQGAVFRFSGGLEAGANRIVSGPDGAVYVGGIGTQEWGGWDWNGKNSGLQRLAANGKPFFDMLAVRSLGATRMEVEFTAPSGAAAGVPGNYQVRQWNYIPEAGYGLGKQPVQNLTVASVQLSADKRKAVLEIAGMKARHVVYLKIAGVASAANEPLWGAEAWYTQNGFGPAAPTVGALPPAARGRKPGFSLLRGDGGGWRIRIAEDGPFSIALIGLDGRSRETLRGFGPTELALQRESAAEPAIAVMHTGSGKSAARIVPGSMQ